MMLNSDIWASAKFLVDVHGGEAVQVALGRAVALSNEGDLDGVWLWAMVAKAAHQITKPRPDRGERVH
ncbi:MAG TPA: hypothetical protein VNT30_25460 [Stellaceae bacterium]|nr:hypothetical protein [Stellaceae bacterium]